MLDKLIAGYIKKNIFAYECSECKKFIPIEKIKEQKNEKAWINMPPLIQIAREEHLFNFSSGYCPKCAEEAIEKASRGEY